MEKLATQSWPQDILGDEQRDKEAAFAQDYRSIGIKRVHIL